MSDSHREDESDGRMSHDVSGSDDGAAPWDVFVCVTLDDGGSAADDDEDAVRRDVGSPASSAASVDQFTVDVTGAHSVQLSSTQRPRREVECAAAFGPDAPSDAVVESVIAPHVHHLVSGVDSVIALLGTAGSGKRSVFIGTPDAPGLLPQACERLIREVREIKPDAWMAADGGVVDIGLGNSSGDDTSADPHPHLTSSFVALTATRVVDLCDPENPNVCIDPALGFAVVGARERFARTADDVLDTLDEGLDGERALLATGGLDPDSYTCAFTLTCAWADRAATLTLLLVASTDARAHTAPLGALRSAVSLRASNEDVPIDLLSEVPLTRLLLHGITGGDVHVSVVVTVPCAGDKVEGVADLFSLIDMMGALSTNPAPDRVNPHAVAVWRQVRGHAADHGLR